MLRITQQDSAQGAKRYYATADYYSEGQEIVGAWGGKGARMLGLDGKVDKRSFDRLCDNVNPRDSKPLTARTRADRTVGYDFTFSVPKSLSLLYSLNDDQDILAAFRGAVDETMRDIEAEMKTRVRKGGRDTDRVTGNMVWAEFLHTTSRPVDGVPDPQLHAHCFVFNTTWDNEERQWKAGQFRSLKADAPYFQAAFRARLAGKLQQLGYGIERKRDDFEIMGVPKTAIKRFSRRTAHIDDAYVELLAKHLAKLGHGVMTKQELDVGGVVQTAQQILKEAQRRGIDDPNKKGDEEYVDLLAKHLAKLGHGVMTRQELEVDGVVQSAQQILEEAKRRGIDDPDTKAALGARTREAKSSTLSWNALRKEWDERLTDPERQAITETYGRRTPWGHVVGGEELAVDHAMDHCFTRESVVAERKLLTEALKRGLGSVTVEGVHKELAARSLIRGEEAGRAVATSWELKQAEEKLVQLARDGRGRYRPLADASRPLVRDWLNDGQKEAVRHVFGSRDFVTTVRGPAGAGKTSLESEIGDGLKEAGVPLVAVAQSTAAVDALRDEAQLKDAETIARFLVDKKLQERARFGVVLMDEGSLVGTRDMLAVFEKAAELRARIVVVGDTKQNRSVSAGEPMRLLEERAGLPRADVNEIVRQTHGDYKKAAQALSEWEPKNS